MKINGWVLPITVSTKSSTHEIGKSAWPIVIRPFVKNPAVISLVGMVTSVITVLCLFVSAPFGIFHTFNVAFSKI